MKRGYMHPQGDLQTYKLEAMRHQGFPMQVRWDYREETVIHEEGEELMWSFNYDKMVERWEARKRPYAKDVTVWLNGKVWLSMTDNNTSKPRNNSTWQEVEFHEPEPIPDNAPEWVQPQGAHDAYAMGEVVMHAGKKWVSNHPANVWQPGTGQYLNLWIAVEEEQGGYPVWVQPTGAHDAYAKDAIVWFPDEQGQLWISTIAANVWQPGVYGWKIYEI